ncbi:MAG TPA: ABC transporter ATP-binding protein, partial [Micromonosporaceae bacterium]|nr:ABC transporter ATP-binding protein [Micromonosporaceae bacterium]
MLTTEGLTWKIGEVSIVDNVSIELKQGEFLGV